MPAGVLPAPSRDYISFSAIRTYQTCPLRYYFKYVAGLPEETVAASLVFGGAVHRAIEWHFSELLAGGPSPELEQLLEQYQFEWDTRGAAGVTFQKDSSKETLDVLARRMLEAFAASPQSRPEGRILAVEEQLRAPVIPGLPDLLARIDLVIETGEALVVCDWKTSRSRWSSQQAEESADQLLLYSELVREFAPQKPVRIQFSVLTKTKEVSIDEHSLAAEPRQVERTKRVVEHVWQAIESKHFFPAPSPMSCSGCPFHGPCRTW